LPAVIELTPEQEEIQRVCRDFAAREIRPAAAAVDEADTETPWELWHKAAAVGLTSFMLPEELGGGGLTDVFTGCLVQEELCHGCSGIGNLITSNGFFAEPVMALGTGEQKKRWLRPLTSERPPMTALATTEPDFGSDAASMRTTARRVDGGYVLDGQKAWISNGGVARFYVVFATVAPGTGHRGVTAFLLDRDDAGLSFGEPVRKMGQRAIVNTELFLSECFVPEDRRLGAEGEGFRGLMETFDRSRVTLAAAATGLARAATEYATAYAPGRRVPARRHGAARRRLPPARLARRADARPRRARDDGGRDGEAARVRDRHGLHVGRGPDARRVGLLARVPGREVDARREARGDRGGHVRHPAPRHLARIAALT
jgi:alkylation response protein AidB-like acyl-CoA dehydrogenase